MFDSLLDSLPAYQDPAVFDPCACRYGRESICVTQSPSSLQHNGGPLSNTVASDDTVLNVPVSNPKLTAVADGEATAAQRRQRS